MDTFDICIIGSGPAGIFSSLELVDEFKVLILESGKKFNERKKCLVIDKESECKKCNEGNCNIISGFGGAFCSKSGGILSLYPAGSSLIEYYSSEDSLLRDYNRAVDYWRNFSRDKIFYVGSENTKDIRRFSDRVKDFGGVYKHYNGYKLYTDTMVNTIQSIEDILSSKANLKFNSEVISVTKNNDFWLIVCKNGQKYLSKSVLFATGRKGNSFLSKILDELNINCKKTGIDLGIRLEIPKDKIDHLANLHPDIKIKFNINGEEVRTFCFCPKGRLLHFNQYDHLYINGMDLLEGYIDENYLSKRTNISFLHRLKFDTTNEVLKFKRDFEDNYQILGGKIIAQRFDDLGKKAFYLLPKSTTLKDYLIGDIFSLLPEKSVYVLIDSINRFNNLLEGKVIDEETIIAAPEMGNFWPEIDMKKDFKTNVEGIFIAGDALGFIRGALQASVTGIKAAKSIRNFLHGDCLS